MDRKKKKLSPLARFRGFIQAGATLLTNLHLPNFAKGALYQGGGKYVCVPGLNCYSCPGAAGACPVGAFQAVVGSSKFRFSYYITGILILFGVLLGRFICGFLCPFGWFQELLHKIPSPKLSTKKLKPLRYLKYAVLLVMVVLLPLLAVNELGMGDPFFCKYLCPQGVLEGAIPLSLTNAGIRAALGKLFTWKPASCWRSSWQRGVLPPLLQVAVPAGRVLCAAEQGLAVPDARRHPQMRLLRSLCKGLQDGRRHYQDPQPRRMHPLRDVHESLPHGRHSVQVRAGGPIKYRNNKGVKP